MKRMLVPTRLGRSLLRLRARMHLVSLGLRASESLGTACNDFMADVLLASLCKSGAVYLDVGAHIGSSLGQVTAGDPTIVAHAFEAVPAKAAHLRRAFPKVRVHECAVGDRSDQVTFFIDTRRSGRSSLSNPEPSNAKRVQPIQVRLVRLDDAVPHSNVDLIKVDVEGGELDVLRGAPRILELTRPTIMLESAQGSSPDSPDTRAALWELLDRMAYDLVIPCRLAHDGPPLGLGSFLEGHYHPRRTTNYFAVARERRHEIRDRARAVLGISP